MKLVLFPLIIAALTRPEIAASQEAPLRPGLWETRIRTPSDESIREQMQRQLEKMDAAGRADFDKKLADRENRSLQKVCLTEEKIKRGLLVEQPRQNCERKMNWRGKTSVISMTCDNGMTVRAEFDYPDPEHYVGWVETNQGPGAKGPGRIQLSGRWLDPNCGDAPAPRD